MIASRAFTYEGPRYVLDEPGSRHRIGRLAAGLGIRRLAIVTDAGVVKAGLLTDMLASLKTAGLEVVVFDKVLADPPSVMIEEAAKMAGEAGADGVLGIGGGSSLDTAKLVAVLNHTTLRLDAIYGVNVYSGGRLPLLLAPTTAGTGSEVTPVSVVTTPTHEKVVVWSPALFPDVALLDAELTLGLPPAITAATAVDGMTHCIEAFTNIHRKNPISDALALSGLSLITAHVREAVTNGRNLEARRHVLTGAMMAGLAFLNSPVGAVHALAYPLGGHFHVPHGLSNGLMLPHVLRFNREAGEAFYAGLAGAVLPGRSFPDQAAAAAAFIDEIEAIIVDIGLERRLSALGIKAGDIEMMADDAIKIERLLNNNPRPVTRPDIVRLYQQAL